METIITNKKISYLLITKSIFFILIMFCSFSSCETKEKESIEIYVAIDGADNADGSISKPFATIQQAVKTVREYRKFGRKEAVVIYLREGRHQINKTLILGVNDGFTTEVKQEELKEPGAGTNISPAHLTFAAHPNEKPIVSAGIPILNWKLAKTNLTDLPPIAKGKVWEAAIPDGLGKFYTLYDKQGRLNRARGNGFVPTKTGDKRTLHFPKGTLKNWDNLADVEIQVRPSRAWVINMLPLASVNEELGVAKTGVSATYEIGKLPAYLLAKMGESAASVWVENVLEGLDEPGEWVVNTKTAKIYLWPANPALDGSPKGILAPSTSELIRVEGDIDYDNSMDKPVQGIAFTGITFSHGDRKAWTNDKERLGWGMQHDWDMFDSPTAMLRFRGAENCQVISCNFINSGGTGVRFDLYAQRNRVENCEFAHLGEAGILLAGYGPGTKDVNKHNDIINNQIHHFSEIAWHSPGVWAWQSGSNHIANNYIHHSGYCGVLITCRINPTRTRPGGEGSNTVRQNEISEEIKNSETKGYENWKLREKYFHSRHNLLEYNEITHAVQKLSDGNGIYVSGAGKGNIVRYNYLHDNIEPTLPAAIRCDDDQHETLIYGNVLYNNNGFSAGIASKGVNDIINNFIVAPRVAPISGYLSFEWVPVPGSKVSHNIIISHPDGGNANNERPRRDQTTNLPNIEETDMDGNLYFHPTDPNWMNDHFARMRAVGKEKESLFGDPLFINPNEGNFGFQEGSPALKLGIEPLDVSKMGLLNKK